MRALGTTIKCRGLWLFLMGLSQIIYAQRMLSEGTLQYSVEAIATTGNEILAGAFEGASQTVWLRGNLCRVDFDSPLRKQSTYFNAGTGEATILRESGEDRYRWNLDASQWKTLNTRWEALTWNLNTPTTEVQGYICQSARALSHDGDSIVVYFTKQITPLIKDFEPMFAGIEGFPVQYEIRKKGLNVRYTLVSIQTLPVGASRFDLPESGYKILRLTENNNVKREKGN